MFSLEYVTLGAFRKNVVASEYPWEILAATLMPLSTEPMEWNPRDAFTEPSKLEVPKSEKKGSVLPGFGVYAVGLVTPQSIVVHAYDDIDPQESVVNWLGKGYVENERKIYRIGKQNGEINPRINIVLAFIDAYDMMIGVTNSRDGKFSLAQEGI